MKLLECYNNMKLILGPDYQEPFEAVKAVEEFRQYWKPKKVRTLLLAESHVYTTEEDLRQEVGALPNNLPGYPKHNVRFVYCLHYPRTPHFWKVFYSSLNFVKTNADFKKIKSLEEKLELLWELDKKGIWLMDASICGLYVPEKEKPSSAIMKAAIHCSWEGYVRDVIEEAQPERIVVIGKMVWNTLNKILPPNLISKVGWAYQPNAHLSRERHIENYQKIHSFCNS